MTLDPIHRQVHVRLRPDRAFELFTTEMGTWWPRDTTHTRADEDQRIHDVVFEGYVGGRIFEVMTDGTEGYWGTVTAWEPGSHVTFDWRPNDHLDRPHTEVDVRFMAADDGGTIVRLEHRGWERLGDAGHEARGAYGAPEGWGTVLEVAFVDAAAKIGASSAG